MTLWQRLLSWWCTFHHPHFLAWEIRRDRCLYLYVQCSHPGCERASTGIRLNPPVHLGYYRHKGVIGHRGFVTPEAPPYWWVSHPPRTYWYNLEPDIFFGRHEWRMPVLEMES